MRRWMGFVAPLVMAAGLVAFGSAAAQAAPVTPDACSTPAVIQITSLGFAPASVTPGHSSTATLAARNCTATTQKTTITWTGQFISSSTSGPVGCPVIDPLARPTTFAPDASITQSTTYSVLASCTATGLQVTVKITSTTGTLLATRTATLIIT